MYVGWFVNVDDDTAWGPYNMEIVDDVIIPQELPPGEYVLGFRWDCEVRATAAAAAAAAAVPLTS